MTQAMTREEIVAKNVAVVMDHFAHENPDEIESAVALYTDDIVWELYSRGWVLRDKDEVANRYRQLFTGVDKIDRDVIEVIGTEDRVITDELLTAHVLPDAPQGFLQDCPREYPEGSQLRMRLMHVFYMRDFKIAREQAYEVWLAPGDGAVYR